MSEREEKFEKMLYAIQKEYNDTVSKMEKLRLEQIYHQMEEGTLEKAMLEIDYHAIKTTFRKK